MTKVSSESAVKDCHRRTRKKSWSEEKIRISLSPKHSNQQSARTINENMG